MRGRPYGQQLYCGDDNAEDAAALGRLAPEGDKTLLEFAVLNTRQFQKFGNDELVGWCCCPGNWACSACSELYMPRWDLMASTVVELRRVLDW